MHGKLTERGGKYLLKLAFQSFHSVLAKVSLFCRALPTGNSVGRNNGSLYVPCRSVQAINSSAWPIREFHCGEICSRMTRGFEVLAGITLVRSSMFPIVETAVSEIPLACHNDQSELH